MKNAVALVTALLFSSFAQAASHTIKISARDVIPSGYGARGVFEADLNGDGNSQLVADAYTFYYVTQQDRTAAVEVLDPAAGYRVGAMLNFAPNVLMTLAPIPNPGGLPRRFVTVSFDPLAQNAHVDTWTGSPPKRADSFVLPIIPDASVSGIADLDGNGHHQLVLHAMSGLQIIDLDTRAIRATANAACREIHFVAYGVARGLKILCLDRDWQSAPPQIIDGATGNTLFTAPGPVGSAIATGAISGSTPSDLIYFDDSSKYLQHVDLSVPWAPSQLLFENEYDAGYNALALPDLDHDGRADALYFGAPFGPLLFQEPSMASLGGFDFNQGCGTHYAIGYFDHSTNLEIFCSGTGYYSGLVRTFDANAAPLWGVKYSDVAPLPPAVGHVTAGGEEDVVTILGTLTTNDPSVLVVTDGATLNELSRTDIDVGRAVALARNKSVARQDVIVGGSHAVEKVVPGTTAPVWTYNTTNYLYSLAPVDVDGDGQDEVVAVSATVQTVASGGYSHLQLLCDVAVLDTSDGHAVWSLPTPVAGALDGGFDMAIAAVPAQAGKNNVVVGCGGTVRAMAGAGGATLWEIADGAVDIQPITRDGIAQLLIADRTHIERRDAATGNQVASLNGNAESVLDLGSDDNLLVRQGDGTLRRFDAVRGLSWDGSSATGDYSIVSGLAAGSPWTPAATVHAYANTAYGLVRVNLRTVPSIFTDGFEAADTP